MLSDELREELLKKSDITLQSAHDYCRTFEAAEQQKFKFHVPTSTGNERSSGIQFMRKSNGQEGQLLGGVNSAVTSTHLLSQINVLHFEKSA